MRRAIHGLKGGAKWGASPQTSMETPVGYVCMQCRDLSGRSESKVRSSVGAVRSGELWFERGRLEAVSGGLGVQAAEHSHVRL